MSFIIVENNNKEEKNSKNVLTRAMVYVLYYCRKGHLGREEFKKLVDLGYGVCPLLL